MSLGSYTFRSAALRVASAAAILAGSSFLPAKAETTVSPGVNPAVCAKYKSDPASHAQCMYDALGRKIEAIKADTSIQQRRAAEADNRRAESERRGDEADLATDCTKFLIAGVKQGLFKKSDALTVAKGKLTPENACIVARSFGYAKRAELN